MANLIKTCGRALVMIDDSEADLFIAKTCFEKSKLPIPWREYMSGEPFLDYMEATQSDPLKIPALVLLDINMPNLNGFEIIRRIRRLSAYKMYPPIIVFSSSTNPQDRDQALKLGANSFKQKPESMTYYVDFFKSTASLLGISNHSIS